MLVFRGFKPPIPGIPVRVALSRLNHAMSASGDEHEIYMLFFFVVEMLLATRHALEC